MVYNGSYKKPDRSIKNKNMKMDLLLMRLFDFTYAGKAHIFITKRREKFVVIVQGVHLVEDIFVFAPNYVHRFQFDSLYKAIIVFNKVVQFLTSSMDWYTPEFQKNIYSEIFITD